MPPTRCAVCVVVHGHAHHPRPPQLSSVKQGVEGGARKAASSVQAKSKEAKRSVAKGVVKLLDEEEVLAAPPRKRFLGLF